RATSPSAGTPAGTRAAPATTSAGAARRCGPCATPAGPPPASGGRYRTCRCGASSGWIDGVTGHGDGQRQEAAERPVASARGGEGGQDDRVGRSRGQQVRRRRDEGEPGRRQAAARPE